MTGITSDMKKYLGAIYAFYKLEMILKGLLRPIGKVLGFIKILIEVLKAHNSSESQIINHRANNVSNIPKINLRKSLTEWGQPIRKENAGRY